MICALALIYALIAWKLYPHFVSRFDQFVKSPAKLLCGRIAASWLVFGVAVILIPMNWDSFHDSIQPAVVGVRHGPANPSPRPSIGQLPAISSNSETTTSRSTEQAVAAPALRPSEEQFAPATSQTVAPQEPAPTSQQPREAITDPLSRTATPGIHSSALTTRQQIEAATEASKLTRYPSSHCGTASQAAERLICSDQQLISLDKQMLHEYIRAQDGLRDTDLLVRQSKLTG